MSITATDGVRVLTISNNDQTANVVRATEAAEASAASAADSLTYAERAEAAAAETTSEGLLEAIDQAETARDDAQTYASNAATSATGAAASAETASTILDEINRIEATATTLPAGSSATVSYDPASSPIMTFNIPRGDQGVPGDPGVQGAPGSAFTWKEAVADETALLALPSPEEDEGRVTLDTGNLWLYQDSAWTDTGAPAVGPPGPAGTTDYEELINVPATFPPSAHNHDTVYAKLAGGNTMSGALAFSRAAQAMLTFNNTGNANASPTTIRETNAGDFGIVHGSDNTLALIVEPSGTTITEDEAAVTKEKGDARYMRTSNYLDVDRTFATVAEMVASTKNTVGDYVRTLGYLAAGDGGGNDYQIVAAATATADGGSYINLTGISGQAKGLFGDVVNVRQFGPPTSGDASVQINKANLFLQTLKANSTTPVTMVMRGYFEIAEPLYLGGLQRMNFDAAGAKFQVIAGGDLEADGDQCAIVLDSERTISEFALIDCDHICGGIEYESCGGGNINAPRVERHTYIAHKIVNQNSGLSLYDPRGYEWGPSEEEGDTESNYVGYGIYLASTDVRIIGGGCNWTKYPVFITTDGGGDFYCHHPANGNPNYDGEGESPRDNPFIMVSESSYSPNFYDCYFDNGYIWDKTGRCEIKGGRHLVLTSRVDMTHPYMRINMRPDPSVMIGNVSDFDTSIGFMAYGASWMNDASNLVSDIDNTPGNEHGNGYITEYSRKETRFIPEGGSGSDVEVYKQGNSSTAISYFHQPGTGTSVDMRFASGRVELGGSFRPTANDTYQIGTTANRWSTVNSVNLNATGTSISLSGLSTYADNAAALSGGLVAGEVYKTATGELRIVV